MDYSDVSGSALPRAWVQSASGQRVIVVLEAITERLIDTYRDQVFAPVGPN